MRARSILARSAGALVLCLALVASTHVGHALAQGAFVPAPARSDVAYDDSRGILYITDGDHIDRYDVAGGRLLTPFVVPGSILRGLDLSPDGKTIAVADQVYVGDFSSRAVGTARFELVDAVSGGVRTITFPRLYGEGGTWMVAYGSDGRLVISSSYPMYVSTSLLRGYDDANGVTTINSTEGNAALAPSGDRNYIGLTLPGWMTDNQWAVHTVGTSDVQRYPYALPNAWWWGWDIAANRNGTQYAVPNGNAGLGIYSGTGDSITQIDGVPGGAKYSPTADVLYQAKSGETVINAYDTASFSKIASYDFETPFVVSTSSWRNLNTMVMSWPRMAVARDNSLLAATVTGGVRAMWLKPAVTGTVRSSSHGYPVEGATVQLWRDVAGTWSVEATTTTGPGGSWSYVTTDTTPLRVHVADASGAHAPAWVGGADLASAASVVATLAPASADVTLTLAPSARGTITGTLRSSRNQAPLPGISVAAYQEADTSTVIASTTTAADGTYHLNGLSPTSYRLAFTDATGEYGHSFFRSQGSIEAATLISVAASATAVATDTLTYVPYSLNGRVTSGSGATAIAVPRAVVELWRQGSGGAFSLETSVAVDSDGRWSYASDRNEPIKVRVTDPGGLCADTWFGGTELGSATAVVPTRDGTPAYVTMPIPNPGSISGTVRSSKDQLPRSGIQVALYRGAAVPSVLATTVTAADGTYRFDGLDIAGYAVAFTDPTDANTAALVPTWPDQPYYSQLWIDAAGRAITQDITLTWRPANVNGKATSTFQGLPVAGAVAEIWRRGADGGYAFEATVTPTGYDPMFTYGSDDLDPVRVHWVDPSGMHADTWFGGSSLASATDLYPERGGGGPSANVIMPLTNPATIEGVVHSSDHGTPLAGVLAELRIYAWPQTVVATTTTSADGTYRFDGLGISGFTIQLDDPSGAHLPQLYPGGDLYPDNGVWISKPGTVTAESTMTFIPMQLTGIVTSSYRAKPVSGALVEVWRAGDDSVWSCETTLTADAAGSWTYSTDTTAPVRVRAIDPLGSRDPAWLGGTDVASAADCVPLRGTPPRADIVLPMTHPSSISGTVRSDRDNSVVASVSVTLWADDDGVLTQMCSTATAANGTYSFPGLGPSSYRMSFEDPSGNNEPFPAGALIAIAAPVNLTRNVTLTFVPYTVQGTVTSDFHNMPVGNASVEIWRKQAGTWTLADIQFSDYDGTWSYETTSDEPVRIRVSDSSLICEPAWLGGAVVANASDIYPDRSGDPLADIQLHVAQAASIDGVTYDDYTMAALRGVSVSLFDANGDWASILASTTSGPDGSFHFTGLAPGDYFLYYADPTGKYESQWYDYESTVDWADPITIDAPGHQDASAYLDPVRVQYLATLTTATVTVGSGAQWAGLPFTLTSEMYDSMWGDGLDGMPVVVQSSADRIHWSTLGAASANPSVWSGGYQFTCFAPDATPRYYRFYVPATPDVVSTSSPDVFVHPAIRTASWGPLSANGTAAPNVTVAGPMFPLEAQLRDQFGNPVVGASVHVSQSLDGRTWFDCPAIVRETAPGRYTASAEAGRGRIFRFESRTGGTATPAVSGIVSVLAPRKAQCWFSNGLPHVGRTTEISGWLWPRGKKGTKLVSVVVQRRVGGSWKAYKTFRPAIIDGPTGASRARIKLKYSKRGAYRVHMYVPGTKGFLPTTTPWVTCAVV
ncbi:MAG: carboxypeptidase regulatory-like domain-containing protein [Coriobacteriia bacterium]|nr:carboxypeptidase regulatory-like domain-containing protein [Coriobacteriia bacterium]